MIAAIGEFGGKMTAVDWIAFVYLASIFIVCLWTIFRDHRERKDTRKGKQEYYGNNEERLPE